MTQSHSFNTKAIAKQRFIGIRLRLLIGFTLVFSGVFAIAFYWFYSFSSHKAMTRLQEDLESTLAGATGQVDVPELMKLYRTVDPNPRGYPNSPLFTAQINDLEKINEIEPRAFPFIFVRGNQPDTRRMGGELGLERGDDEIVYIVDLQWNRDPTKAAGFLETVSGTGYHLRALENGETTFRELYNDKFGSWITAYGPIIDPETERIVGAMGVDFEADYVRDIQASIRSRVLWIFTLTYGGIFILVYFISGLMARPVRQLTPIVEQIGDGNYDQDKALQALYKKRRFNDEMSTLAVVFELMLGQVRKREENLKQQVEDLKIQIDDSKRKRQVSEIVDTDFFRDLQAKARTLRQRQTSDEG